MEAQQEYQKPTSYDVARNQAVGFIRVTAGSLLRLLRPHTPELKAVDAKDAPTQRKDSHATGREYAFKQLPLLIDALNCPEQADSDLAVGSPQLMICIFALKQEDRQSLVTEFHTALEAAKK